MIPDAPRAEPAVDVDDGHVTGVWIIWVCRALLAIIAYTVATQYTFHPFRQHVGTVVYDEAGQSLLHGDFAVNYHHDAEPFISNGRAVSYYGPFPALLRAPVNLMFPSLFGCWSSLSCLLAAGVFVGFVSNAVRSFLAARGNVWRPAFTIALETGLFLGTPIFFLASTPSLYSESMIWAVAGFAVAFWAFTSGLSQYSRWVPVGLACGFSIALTSRAMFALSTGTMLLGYVLRNAARRQCSRADMAAGLIILCTLCFQGWVNWKNWGNAFQFQDMAKYEGFQRRPDIYRRLLEVGEFSVSRLPTTLPSYFVPSGETFSRSWPFVRISAARDWRLYPNGCGKTVPITLSMLWLVIFVPFGIARILSQRRRGDLQSFDNFHLIGMVGAVAQPAMILLYHNIGLRYNAEYLPAILLFGLPGMSDVLERKRRLVLLLLPCLLIVSSISTALTTIDWLLRPPTVESSALLKAIGDPMKPIPR